MSGLLLAYKTVGGFNFNPDLFSGFITAAHNFAQEASGAKLRTISLGNFRLLIHRGPVALLVLAVDLNDPEARYADFISELENGVVPLLTHEYRQPNGFNVVTRELRTELEHLIGIHLDSFTTRGAPSNLSDLPILREEAARTLLRTLLERHIMQLSPIPATNETGYAYPLTASTTHLSDADAARLLERLANCGLLLTELWDTVLCCPECHSIHLHPRALCPTCQMPAQLVQLYEHLPCGHVGVWLAENQELQCDQCGSTPANAQDFRILRGFRCVHCNASFKRPQILLLCHQCRANLPLEGAEVRVIPKYVLNASVVPELQPLLGAAPSPRTEEVRSATHAFKRVLPKVESIPRHEPASTPSTSIQTVDLAPVDPAPATRLPGSHVLITSRVEKENTFKELEALEKALRSGEISEAEYDRRFVQLRLRLRTLGQPARGNL
jgi:hypothetical protein